MDPLHPFFFASTSLDIGWGDNKRQHRLNYSSWGESPADTESALKTGNMAYRFNLWFNHKTLVFSGEPTFGLHNPPQTDDLMFHHPGSQTQRSLDAWAQSMECRTFPTHMRKISGLPSAPHRHKVLPWLPQASELPVFQILGHNIYPWCHRIFSKQNSTSKNKKHNDQIAPACTFAAELGMIPYPSVLNYESGSSEHGNRLAWLHTDSVLWLRAFSAVLHFDNFCVNHFSMDWWYSSTHGEILEWCIFSPVYLTKFYPSFDYQQPCITEKVTHFHLSRMRFMFPMYNNEFQHSCCFSTVKLCNPATFPKQSFPQKEV